MEMELESIMLPGIDPQRPIVIAGPCSAETEEQVMETAKGIADKGIKLFRAGIWKPRTKPGGFEGIGAEGLQWLKRVKRKQACTLHRSGNERSCVRSIKSRDRRAVDRCPYNG